MIGARQCYTPESMPESGSRPAARYRVVERLRSEAGVIDVCKAVQHGLERPVELRLLDASKLGDQRELLRFEREFRTLATLDHPALYKVLDWGVMGDQVFYVTDWREMQPLQSLLETGWRPRSQELMALAAQLGDALVYLHSKGVVHRSLGVDSVLYNPERGRAAIAQFPMAKDSRLSDLTQQGVSHLSQAAATPECLRESASTESTDLYLLGALLYRCVTGRDPFDLAAVLRLPAVDAASFAANIPPLGSRPAGDPDPDGGLPSAVSALIMRCLAFAPADRPPSARAFLEELAAAEADARTESTRRKHQARRAGDSGRERVLSGATAGPASSQTALPAATVSRSLLGPALAAATGLFALAAVVAWLLLR